ncbi:Uncharacterized protein DBV15_07477 [Temnothorax longispinosus]|uniref:Uncharacterized protein n=1 Tax=Temnothorax longispinosus TaxID=300112 RepID=A0A4S2KJ93_9HYME|nr:Uncharacterized protein DBV15_07477 [Temnothorax longispinosus]
MTDRVPEWISSDNNTRSRGSRTAKAARNILAPAGDPGSPRSPGMLRDDDALGAATAASAPEENEAPRRTREGWCGESRGTGGV